MEKYTKFSDKATGISPFMPIPNNNGSRSPALIPLKVLVSIARTIGSLPFLILLALIPINGIQSLLLRAVLFICGLLSYEVNIQGVKRAKDTTGFLPVKNEVYFVNFTSMMDYFILWLISKDSFVVLIPDVSGKLTKFNTLSFISRALCGDDSITGSEFTFNELTNKIVYIFPEGTTSNGKSIVPFTLTETQWKSFYTDLCQDKKTHKIKTIFLKLYPSHLTTPLNLNTLQYLYRLLSEPSINYKIRINFVEDQTLLKVKNAFAYNGKAKILQGVDLNSKKEFAKVFRGRR